MTEDLSAPTPLIHLPQATSEVVRMFVNGQAMTGGSLNGPLAAKATLIGKTRTAARYRFWCCRNEFPGLEPTEHDGWNVPGELYAVDYATLREELLPTEPPELELGIIVLEDGTGSLSMRLRDGIKDVCDELTEIPPGLDWTVYARTLQNGS